MVIQDGLDPHKIAARTSSPIGGTTNQGA